MNLITHLFQIFTVRKQENWRKCSLSIGNWWRYWFKEEANCSRTYRPIYQYFIHVEMCVIVIQTKKKQFQNICTSSSQSKIHITCTWHKTCKALVHCIWFRATTSLDKLNHSYYAVKSCLGEKFRCKSEAKVNKGTFRLLSKKINWQK